MHAQLITARQRILLGRPLGGLNDIFCQIAFYLAHALQSDRLLVIHTAHVDQDSLFAQGIERYFTTLLPQALVLGLPGWLAPQDPVPGLIQPGHPARAWTAAVEAYAFRLTPGEDGDQRLVVDQRYGGGYSGSVALNYVYPQSWVRDSIACRLAALPPVYSAVHFRNTDYISTLDNCFSAVSELLKFPWPVFLATDDLCALEACRQRFGCDRLISLNTVFSEAGAPIHHSPLAAADDTVISALTDLAALVFARQFRPVVIDNPSCPAIRLSGFSVLAQRLRTLGSRSLRAYFLP